MPQAKLTIREWAPKDRTPLQKIYDAPYQRGPIGAVETPREGTQEHYSLVATDHNDNAVGFASVIKPINPRGYFYLHAGMLKEHRGGKTALQLVESAIKKAHENGVERIYAEVANTPLRIRLMKRLGFKQLVSGYGTMRLDKKQNLGENNKNA